MAKGQRIWVYVGPKKAKAAVPEALKASIELKAKALVENVLRPLHVRPPPKDHIGNHIVGFSTKWYRSWFYFIATYACPGPNALSPSFESKFARMEHVGDGRFALSSMRHNDQWMEIFPDLSADECLKSIEKDPWFHP